MKRKILMFPIVALLLITMGLGCKGPDESQQAAVQPASIEYWTVFNDVTTLRKFAAEYTASKPYLNINIRQVRYDEFSDLFTNALADDVSPDIISVHARSLRKYAPRLSTMPSATQSADVFIKEGFQKETVIQTKTNPLPTPNAIATNFLKTIPADVIIGGNAYGLPLSFDTLAIYYNKDLLDRSGVPLPPTTWGELLDASKKATRFDAAGNIIQAGLAIGTGENVDNSADIFAALLLQNGVPVEKSGIATFGNGIKDAPENHPTRQTLRFYTDFARPTKEAYSWNNKQGNALDAFAEGRAVFFVGFAFDAQRITSRAPQFDIGTIPLPQLNPGSPSSIANYWVEAVPSRSANKNAAWDFVRFITTPEKIAEYNLETLGITPLRSQISDQIKDTILGPFASSALNAENWYRGFDIDVTTEAMKVLIDQFLQPYGEGQDPLERDANMIIDTASIIQQTL
jgi:ABC-type glycerol-3-phosphate transport system substrate-binding protein